MVLKKFYSSRIIFTVCFSLLCLHHLYAQQSEQELEQQVISIFEQNCAKAGCHLGPNAQQGMELTAENFYATAVNEPSVENPNLKRIDPGSPSTSYLVKKIKGAPDIIGAPMPLTGDRLSEEQIKTIEDYISSIEEVDEDRKRKVESNAVFAFEGKQNINLPTTRTQPKGSGFFYINHRFNPSLGDGFDAFYGLDGSAIIFIGLGYAITDDLFVSLGRTNASDNIELSGHYRLLQQTKDGENPLSISIQSSLNWVAEKPNDPDLDRLRGEAIKFSTQASFTRKFFDQVGLAFVPGVLVNADENIDNEDVLITLGLGARWNFHKRLSWMIEWAPIVSGYTLTDTFGNLNRFDTWGTGLEIATGGHTFQIVMTNSVGLATDQYMRGGDLDPTEFFDGKIRLGFNIYRVLNF